MNLKPMHDWAVIRPFESEEMTAGGLYIPDSAKEKTHEGVVVAIGPGAHEEEKYGKKKEEKKKERRFIPTIVKPGDLVLYEQYAGQTYKIGNEELVLVRERDILGILPERAARKPLQIPAATSTAGSTELAATEPKKSASKKPAKKK